MRFPRDGGGIVVRYTSGGALQRSHERASRDWVAAKLAALLGYDFAGDYDPGIRYDRPLYFVPSATIVGVERARELGIHCEDDFFGGLVPHSFIATKTITHPLVAADAVAPEGWSHAFGARVRDAVFPGYSAFTHVDARVAAERVLQRGSARVKLGQGIGGTGQHVIASLADLDALLAGHNAATLARDGLVIEWNLEQVRTYSVGQVRVAGMVASYCGTQRLTANTAGVQVYGGSDLVVARGGYDALLRHDLAPETRLAVEQARKYDAAAAEEFPGLLASRRNYDVAQGCDGEGQRCSGVLEQSWRIGGASAAEVAALEAFRADPRLQRVRASTVEIYGIAEIPPGAAVQFSGSDDHAGAITKYCLVEIGDDAS